MTNSSTELSSPRYRVVIVGASEVGREVADLCGRVEFEVNVVDAPPDTEVSAPGTDGGPSVVGPLEDALSQLPIDSETFCIVVRRSYRHDLIALKHLVQRSFGYLGMIGNRRKIESIMAELREAGIPEATLSRIRAPIGLPIGSRTVPEIAISIVAELIATRNLRNRAGHTA